MQLEKIFKNFKKSLIATVEDLEKEEYFTQEEAKEIKEILEKEKLTVSVIGQMKYGKSTFVNAYIFGKQFLPSAHTPMTASLTKIEYSDKEEYIAELFTEEEWEKLKIREKKANSYEDEFSKRILENIEKGEKVLSEEPGLLGKQISVNSAEEIKEFVGINGKYTPITKMLTIKYPAEILKDADFVDTPGINDPVIERERRTLEFIKKSDVVLLFSSSSKVFDKTDKDVTVRELSKAGIGKVILVLNKIDEALLEEPDKSLEEIKEKLVNRVKENLYNAIDKEIKSEEIKKILKETKIVPISALWALLGKADKEVLNNNKDLQDFYKHHLEEFDFIKTKEDFLKYSGLSELEEEMINIIKNHKLVILIDKANTQIVGKLIEKIGNFTAEKTRLISILRNLSLEDKDIEKRLKELKEYKEKSIIPMSDIRDKLEETFDKEFFEIKRYLSDEQKQLEDFIDTFSGNDSPDGREKALIEIKSHIEGKFIDIRRKIEEELLLNFKSEIRNILKKRIEDLFDRFFTSKINYYSELDFNDKERIKNYILDKTSYELDLKINEDVKIDVEEGFSIKFLFKGKFKGIKTSLHEIKSNAKEEVRKKTNSFEDEVKKKLDNMKEPVDDILYKINEMFYEKVMKPIGETLNEVKEQREKLKSQQEELKKQVKILEEKISKFEQKKSEVERKLNALKR